MVILEKKRKKRNIAGSANVKKQIDGIIYVTLTKNNTLLTLTDAKGDVLTWTSCRNCGFYGSQKTTQLATITAAEEIGLRGMDLHLKKVNVVFRGKPKLRQAVLRGLTRSKISVQEFIIVPAIPYNGCRLEKKSRK